MLLTAKKVSERKKRKEEKERIEVSGAQSISCSVRLCIMQMDLSATSGKLYEKMR